MKTQILLRTLLLTVVFATASVVAAARTHNETRFEVQSSENLKEVIAGIFKNDLSSPENFLNESNVHNIEEDVVLKFYINSDQQIKVIAVECSDALVAEYVKNVLNNREILADNSMQNKRFMLGLKVVFRS